MNDGVKSRKFWLTCFVVLVSTYAYLFTDDKMDGPTWVALCTLVLGVSFTANVMEKKQ